MIRPGRAGAIALVAALGAAVPLLGGPGPSPPPAQEAVVPTPSEAVTRLTRDTAPIVTTIADQATTSARLGPMTVTEEALAAWGRFAVSGDLHEVEPWFDSEGPQYARFVEEAEALAGEPLGLPAYRVTASEMAVHEEPGEATVWGRVTFVRTGEPSQSFWWEIVLRPDGRGWKVWTVSPRRSSKGRTR